ncbi:MAG: DUF1552 domain-containing protein [Isosphaeraceae bacterium]
MTRSWQISRRTVLRGVGAAVALPWLEAMAPAADLAGAATKATTPLRMAFLYVPNGVHMEAWKPEKEGSDFELPDILKPLQPFKDELLVLSGLAQDTAYAHGDGPGDHARSLACFLTGAHPLKTDGANIKAGISVDQVAADKVGKATRFASLELGIDRGAQSGNCDSGYSCAYSSNISWRSPTTPMAKEVNPRLVFDRLFASQARTGTAAERARRDLYRRSILDFVAEDASQLRNRLGMTDRRKLDEYLTAVREIEQRVARAESQSEPDPGLTRDIKRPSGIPQDNKEHLRLMADLLVLAFQGDLTRVSTFMFANEGSNKSYSFIGVPDGHHDLSHHGGDPKKHAKIQKINTFHIEQLAYMLGKMKTIREGDGTLLDHVMVVYGSGIGDGNRHNHNDLPVLVAGRGGGTLKTGRHLVYERNTPLNNLYVSMLDRVGVKLDRLGDSTGRLDNLKG